MNVTLTSEYEQMVQQKVDAGRFRSPSDVVAEALRLMEQNDQLTTFHKEQVRREIDEARASLKRGEGVDGDEFFDRMEAELDALERQS